jgi:hypothetical protein
LVRGYAVTPIAAIPPPGEEADASALRWLCCGSSLKTGWVFEDSVEARRDQSIQRLTEELAFSPSEEPLHLAIKHEDLP